MKILTNKAQKRIKEKCEAIINFMVDLHPDLHEYIKHMEQTDAIVEDLVDIAFECGVGLNVNPFENG